MVRSLVLALVFVALGSALAAATPPEPARAPSRARQQLSIDGVCARPGSLVHGCGGYVLLAETPLERLLRAHRKVDAGNVDKAAKARQRIEMKLREMTSGGIVEDLR